MHAQMYALISCQNPLIFLCHWIPNSSHTVTFIPSKDSYVLIALLRVCILFFFPENFHLVCTGTFPVHTVKLSVHTINLQQVSFFAIECFKYLLVPFIKDQNEFWYVLYKSMYWMLYYLD